MTQSKNPCLSRLAGTIRSAVLAASFAFAPFAPADAQTAAPDAQSALNGYNLGVGDKVRITVFGEDDLSGEFLVGDNGAVAMPLIGNVPAQDKTLADFEGQIIAMLKQGYIKEPKVSVQILSYRPFYISGEVTKGGDYPYVVGLNARTAVAMAGGYTYRANKSKIYITRAKTQKREEFPADQTTIILPGDVIEVPERYF